MIAIGNINASKVYLGSEEISKIYLGSTQIWGGSSPTPVPPYDAEVEYLEGVSDATDPNNKVVTYIDTGIKSSSNVRFELTIYTPSSTSNYWIFGSRVANQNGQLCVMNDITAKRHWRYNNQNASSNITISEGKHTFSNVTSRNKLVIDGISTTTATDGTFTTNYNFFLFTCNNAGSQSGVKSGQRIYSAKFYVSGVLTLDMIPVRVGQVGYMYDKVSGELFGNAGTGNFILGNDVID